MTEILPKLTSLLSNMQTYLFIWGKKKIFKLTSDSLCFFFLSGSFSGALASKATPVENKLRMVEKK